MSNRCPCARVGTATPSLSRSWARRKALATGRASRPPRRPPQRQASEGGALFRRGSLVEQSRLATRRHGQPEVGIAAAVEAPPSCRARDEAQLNEEGFDHV